MVEIAPFEGITFNTEKIGKIDDVMSPPYDIISPEMQTKLYEKNEYNFVRLILGKQFPSDTDHNNRYTRARELFDVWQKKHVLVASSKQVIYPYKIEYTLGGKKKTMNGFFVLLKLDPEYKLVKAHERTLSKPKADRLNLMRACTADLEPIQLLYMDTRDALRKRIDKSLKSPFISVKGYDGFTHTLWKIEDETIIAQIKHDLHDKVLFIADGHHRYQTAINFASEMREKTGNADGDAPFNYKMVILVNMFDEGLEILPTHRLITMPTLNREKFVEKLREYFSIEEKTVPHATKDYDAVGKNIKNDIKTDREHKCALYFKDKYYILTLKDEAVMDRFAGTYSKTWRTLDVSILHKIVLEHILGITEKTIEDHVKYTRVDGEALQFVDEGKCDFSVLINATKINELKAIADAGEHMPQKSTYFLPKMLSGLVMYKM